MIPAGQTKLSSAGPPLSTSAGAARMCAARRRGEYVRPLIRLSVELLGFNCATNMSFPDRPPVPTNFTDGRWRAAPVLSDPGSSGSTRALAGFGKYWDVRRLASRDGFATAIHDHAKPSELDDETESPADPDRLEGWDDRGECRHSDSQFGLFPWSSLADPREGTAARN
jgi:hypothetical protein